MRKGETLKLMKAKEHLNDLISQTENNLSDRKNQINSITEDTSKTEADIKRHFWETIEFLLSEDRRLVKELNELKDFQLKQLHEVIDSDYKTLQHYQGQFRLISQMLESNNDEKSADVDEICKSVTKTSDRKPLLDPTKLNRIEFVYDESALMKAVKQVPYTLSASPSHTCSKAPLPVFSRVISARSSKDKAEPDVRDVAVTEVDGVQVVTVTDWANKCIKSFYKKQNRQKQCLLVPGGSPFGITSIGSHVFVTDPASKKILKLTVYPGLHVTATVATEKMYCGIATIGESMLVASGYEWSNTWASFWTVDILDTNGIAVKSIKDRVLQSPEYIATSRDGTIVAADKGTRSLIYLSSNGDEYLTVTPSGGSVYRLPQGVTVTRTGNVLLVDTLSNKVIEMTDSGEFIRDVMTSETGLDKPRGIWADSDGHVFVTCGDNVRVYTYT